MKRSASEEASFESSGWPEIFANAFTASSRALWPRLSGEKYRCRNEARLGRANFRSEEASFESSGWPEIFANAFTASSRALWPRLSGEKYRCRNEARLGRANF